MRTILSMLQAAADPALLVAALGFACAMALVLVAYALDPRTLGAASVWLKPLKFAASLALFLATLGWAMPLAGDFRDTVAGRFVVWGAVLPSVFELAYIAWRASRGEASHFNVATPFAAAMFTLMGVGSVVLTAAAPVLAWGVAVSPVPLVPAVRLAVVLGLALTFFLGGGAGIAIGASGGHAVGVPPAGDAVVPLFGWSRSVGDLRVAHFLGIHAQQVLPLLGLLAAWLVPEQAVAVVVAGSTGYAVLTVATFVQALAGRPLLPLVT